MSGLHHLKGYAGLFSASSQVWLSSGVVLRIGAIDSFAHHNEGWRTGFKNNHPANLAHDGFSCRQI